MDTNRSQTTRTLPACDLKGGDIIQAHDGPREVFDAYPIRAGLFRVRYVDMTSALCEPADEVIVLN